MRVKTRAILIGSLFGVTSLFMACTSKITEEQLKTIRDLKKQEAQIQEAIKNRDSEIAAIRSEIEARQRELDRCREAKAFVEEKLAKWPDVWPDWKPGQKADPDNNE